MTLDARFPVGMTAVFKYAEVELTPPLIRAE
jgi:hypothetical protein